MRDYSTISALFGNSDNSGIYNINLGDYNLIKSGNYLKLMKAYYGQNATSADAASSEKAGDKSSKTSGTSGSLTANNVLSSRTDTTGLSKMKAEADELENSAKTLSSSDTWKQGNNGYDTDKIYSSIKSFVSQYNDVVEQSGKITSTGSGNVSNQVKWMTSLTSTMSNALGKVGITVGTDSKLSLDEDALKSANIKNVKELFSGSTSYGGQIAEKAAGIESASVSSGIYGNDGSLSSTLQGMFSAGI